MLAMYAAAGQKAQDVSAGGSPDWSGPSGYGYGIDEYGQEEDSRRFIPKSSVNTMGKSSMAESPMTFEQLVDAIQQVHDSLSGQAVKAVNVSLTLRNWMIGCYIQIYEQNGSDRAAYGERLLDNLAARLEDQGLKRTSVRELRRFRRFFQMYPQIREALTPEFHRMIPPPPNESIREALTPELASPAKDILERMSFSHLAELIAINDSLKRAFYEIECIRGNWSVRELKRQIASLYYERSGYSKDKQKLADLVQSKAETDQPALAIRDPYVFEFLGLKPQEVIHESDVEESMLDRLQEFLLEMGRGFCLEARQKRILIGDEYFFVDLVFYHRLLKCHVLIELKIDAFNHEYLGQLNTYVNWYRRNEITEGDNPPVGILLCTQKNETLVDYALAGLDNQLFVTKYQLQLPGKDDIRRFLEEQMQREEN